MAKRAAPAASSIAWGLVAFVVLAFVSSGAWQITWLPPVPEAQALHLGTLGVLALIAATGFVRVGRLDLRLAWGLGAVAVSVALSWLAGGHLIQAAFYGIYESMSLVQWLAFPAAFALSAALVWDVRSLKAACSAVVLFGALLAVVQAYQNVTGDGFTEVFGSTGYGVTALSVLVPIAVGLAASSQGRERWAWYGVAAIIAVSLGALSGAVMGALVMLFAIPVAVAVHARAWRGEGSLWRRPGMIAVLLAALMFGALLIAQVPLLTGGRVSGDAFGGSESMASRAYMWEGAQRMVAERPVLGFGPAGYRTAAVEYFDPAALSFGPDLPGNTDPTVYSPQSPHSLMWEIATRLGILGLLAFVGLLVAWAFTLADKVQRRGEDLALRAGLAGGFACAMFSMLVNPPLFAIGLLVAVAAGLAVSPGSGRNGVASSDGPSPVVRIALAVSGVATVAVALWLVYGVWVAESAPPDEPIRAMAAHERALGIAPGHPTFERRLLDMRLFYAVDAAEIAAVQQQVDAAPGYITGFAPNLVNFAARSMEQAQRTGRSDLSWERATLERAAEQIPPIPSLVAERLRLAVLEGDRAAIEAAIPEAERWGGPYPFTDDYLEAARQALQ